MCGHSKYTRCSIIANKVFTQMMQEIIGRSPVSPDHVYQIIMSTKRFKERLKHLEMTMIQTLQTEGFSNLDANLVYKIGKFFNFIPPPTQQWGTFPLPNEIEIGDDIERIRNARNEMVHNKDCEMSDEEMSAFFTEFIAVGERIDVYLNKESGIGFKDSIVLFQTCPLDEEMEENAKALQRIESLNEQFQVSVDGKVIQVFYGNSMKEGIEGCRHEDASSSSAVIFVVKGVEDLENKAELLNSLSNQINNGSSAIQLKEARNGSMILYTDIKNSVLQNGRNFAQEFSTFMEIVFTTAKLKVAIDETCSVIMIPNEDDEHTSTDVEFIDNVKSTDLVLELKDFSTNESLQQHDGCFIKKVSQVANEKETLIRSDSIAEIYPGHGRVLKEVIPDIENSSDQEKGDEKQDQESGVNKSLVQIPEEHITGSSSNQDKIENNSDKSNLNTQHESTENKVPTSRLRRSV